MEYKNNMLTKQQLISLLTDTESHQAERTTSITDIWSNYSVWAKPRTLSARILCSVCSFQREKSSWRHHQRI